MKEYDVVVVGAGIAGSSAAKSAAERGVKTLLIEEHPEIGLPEQCEGRVVGTKSGILKKLLDSIDQKAIVSWLRARQIYTPSGRMAEFSLEGSGAAIVQRNMFDLELAKQAAHAGVDIMLNTRVIGLIHKDGFVVGVNTSSKTNPQIRAKVVIGAEGHRSVAKGIMLWEGISQPNYPGFTEVKFYLTGVKDIEVDVIETHFGPWDSRKGQRNWIFLVPRGKADALVSFSTAEDYERIKALDLPLSRKIKDSKPLRMTGVWLDVGCGAEAPKRVKDGLILAGAAAKDSSIDRAIFSGQFAGQVAAEAIQAGDWSEKKLSKHHELCEKQLSYDRGKYMDVFWNLTNEEIERKFDEVTAIAGVATCDDIIPV